MYINEQILQVNEVKSDVHGKHVHLKVCRSANSRATDKTIRISMHFSLKLVCVKLMVFLGLVVYVCEV